jgi:hypothetical protein
VSDPTQPITDELFAALKTLSSQLGVGRIAPAIMGELIARGWAVKQGAFNPYLTATGHKALKSERRQRGEGG